MVKYDAVSSSISTSCAHAWHAQDHVVATIVFAKIVWNKFKQD